LPFALSRTLAPGKACNRGVDALCDSLLSVARQSESVGAADRGVDMRAVQSVHMTPEKQQKFLR
jgi:hypothetical protein